MGKSKIEWTERTWNPFRGCTRVSEGCRNCYAERLAARFGQDKGPYEGFSQFIEKADGTKEPRWTGKVEVLEKLMSAPINVKKPSLFFVNSMSDTFHASIPDETIFRLFETMRYCNGDFVPAHHHFQVLTKRPERMLSLWKSGNLPYSENIWLGISVEDVQTVSRLEVFKDMGARVQWVSAEPLLEDITDAIRPYLHFVDWLVVGGESGPNARPMNVKWAYDLYIETFAFETAYFFKQMGGRKDKGSTKLYSPYESKPREFEAKAYPHGWRFGEGLS